MIFIIYIFFFSGLIDFIYMKKGEGRIPLVFLFLNVDLE